MPNWNKVELMGNLTRDPELLYSPKGTAIAKIGMAINREWTQDGQKKEEVTFVDVTAFGKQAETIGQYMRKGRPLFIAGRLTLESWEDKTTHEKKSKLGVVMESFQFLGGKDEQGDGEASRPAQRPATKPAPAADDDDNSVPF